MTSAGGRTRNSTPETDPAEEGLRFLIYTKTMSTIVRIVALILSIIGITGELMILRHDLVECYPFKMMTYPPGQFYEDLGNVGVPATLVAMLACAFVVAMKRPVFAPAVMTAIAPLAVVAVVAGVTVAMYGLTVPAGIRNFDRTSIADATGELAAQAVLLSIAGVLIGAVCGAILRSLNRRSAVIGN